MPEPYGYILTSHPWGCTRAVFLDGERVCVEHLTVEHVVTLSREELDAIAALELLLNDESFRVRFDPEDDPNPLFDL